MRPMTGARRSRRPDLQLQSRILRGLVGGLVLIGALLGIAWIDEIGFGTSVATTTPMSPPGAAEPSTSTSMAAPSATAVATTTAATTVPESSPPLEARYIVPESEIEPEAKQLAADIAFGLTTYQEPDDPEDRFALLAGAAGADLLAEAGAPLTHPGRWSRGAIVYPQLGGLTDERASVMVVTRQNVGSGTEVFSSLVRTIDVRLLMGESGWELEELASAGGVFDGVEDLTLAHAVAADPRIEMPDSARLDILAGEVSPVLLDLMTEMADQAPYGVTVMMTGHPYHVFGTDRISHHTIGRAIDIYRVDGRLVVDDRGDDSATKALVEWLFAHPDVVQIGSPWDLDGPEEDRSFTDTVHQDHLHVAVVGES